jgi:membrane protein DedA with SNARE-associated domain
MVHDIVDFIGRHASWAGPIMFGLAFGESFAFLSLLFPGTTIMIAAGAFIPGGTLDFWPLVIGCVTGAIAGDAISFWLGRRYGYLIARVWPFRRRPELLARGFAFFERHGGKSVFIGRFFGPLRAVIPLVAGIARMPSRRFWLANVLSALVWAPVLLLPGALTVWAARSLQIEREWEWISIAAIAAAVAIAIWAARKYHLFGRN